MRVDRLIVLAILASSAVNIAHAAEGEGPKGLSGAAEFGMILTSGNSDSSTINGNFSIEHDIEKWLHRGRLSVVNTESENVTTAERYVLKLKSNYKLTEDQFLFGSLTHDVDEFSGFDYQTSVAVGYGRQLYNTENYQLSVEVGPGYRTSKLKTGGDESESILHIGANTKYIVNEATFLEASLNIDHGSDQTVSELDAGYVNKLNSSLALKLGYNVKHSSEVPAGSEKTDTITSVSLLYSF
jgi:putative salt-induced outer membrane protein